MKLDPWPLPLWIAHRGAGKLAPENTLAAFRLGASHGYRAFECDVKLSADGVPFLLHDDTLDRTTPSQGVAGLRPWVELSRLDAGGWHSRAFAGEPLPSLDAIARYVRRNGFALNLEIKPTPGLEHATGLAVGAACAALWQDGGTPLLFSSFRPEALLGAREAAAHLPRALLVDTLWPGWLEMAQSLECVAAVTNHLLMDSDLVALLHSAGLHALCYTVNDAAQARHLVGLGVDGIITDAVDRLSPDNGGVFD
jgi:glycerophosphoryl diester phosphodiesterase